MRPLVQADDLHLAYGGHAVLRGAGFVIHPGDKVALVGPNGAGKTTIFRILAGRLRPDLGDIQTSPGLRVAYLPQVPDVPPDARVADLLAAPTAVAEALQREVAELEAWMGTPTAWDEPDAAQKMAHYADLQTRLATERSKGDASATPLLNELGVPADVLDATFGGLSGGERSKVLLCKALSAAKDTDLLLLDEPTNHMDIPTVEFIEAYLMDLRSAVVVAAHDEYLLDNVASRVFEVDHHRIFQYDGNYTSYRGQRAAYAKALAAKRKRDFDEVKRQLAIIDQLKQRNRFDAQVTSRKTRLARQDHAAPALPSDPKGFKLFLDADAVPRQVLQVEGLAKSVDGRRLFAGVTFEVEGPDKIGIIGPNGCGKSTLLRVLLGKTTADAGEATWSKSARVGYFDQHHSTLQADRTLIEEVRTLRDPPPADDWTRGLLGRFRFTGDDVFKRVEQLSGGERARLALAKFVAEGHNVLVLDEPTNHLDMESQRIVTAALKAYEGALLVVSHDRAFLDRVCNRLAVFAHRRIGVFPGNFSTAWTSRHLAEFTQAGVQGRFRVRKAFRDWEKDTRYHSGDTITITGMETQAFRRMLRQAEANGWIEAE